MATEIKSKGELVTLSSDLKDKATDLENLSENLKDTLTGLENYDGINITSAGNILLNNINEVTEDINIVSTNINNYAAQLNEFDVDDFSSNDIEGYLDSVNGTRVSIPAGLGNEYSYMGWQCITDPSSNQYRLRESAGMNFDSQGFAKIGDRYVVATTLTFGNVGDYIDVVQSDGTVIKCVIGDIKNQNDAGCNMWGHNNGQCVVEFVVDRSSWYGTSNTVVGMHPEWNQSVNSIINKGNYWDLKDNYSTGAVSNPKTSVSVVASTIPAATTLSYVGTTSGSNSYHPSSSSYAPSSSSGSYYSSDTTYTPLNTTPVTITSGDPNIDVSKYHNNLANGFEVTVGNLAYEVSDADFELLCAIVSAESDKSYDDALAVITTILNRCEAPNWIRSHGTNPVAQATAPNQFVVYQHGSYKAYMNGRAPETVQTAVRDALAGVRNHKYLSFRSNGSTGYSNNMITSSGNRYK